MHNMYKMHNMYDVYSLCTMDNIDDMYAYHHYVRISMHMLICMLMYALIVYE